MFQILRKLVIFTVFGALGFSTAIPAFAVGPSGLGRGIAEDRAENAGSRPGLLRNFLNNGRAAIGSCTITAVNGTALGGTINCTQDSKSYTVNTTAQTQLRRRFWGKASWPEFLVGDVINVIGQWTDTIKTTVNARLIRDTSIQKRFGVFIGTVTSLNGNGWVMTTINRGSQTVTVSSSTKFVNRQGQAIVQSQIKVGDRVRVRGLWDNKANTITEVTNVKDYNLPPKPTPSVTPTLTPTPTP